MPSATRRSSRRSTASLGTAQDLGSYESQAEESEVPWTSKKIAPKSSSRRASRRSSRAASANTTRISVDLEEKSCALYAAVSDPQSALKQNVKDFARRLERSEGSALCELTNLLVQSAGSTRVLSQQDVSDGDKEELVGSLTAALSIPANGYPLAAVRGGKNKAQRKKLAGRIGTFWNRLVESLLGSDERLATVVDHAIEWLKSLSDSAQRAFRYTSAAHAYWIVEALISAAVDLREEKALKERHLESKRTKRQSKTQAEKLGREIESLQNTLDELEELMTKCFSAVFVHRYRDVCAQTRKLSINSIGGWMSTYPSLFVRDSYLKYVGWCLNDKDASVRLASLETVAALVDDDDVEIDKLKPFIARFIGRFLGMVQDTDDKVVVAAIDFASSLLREKLLDDQQGENIPYSLWHEKANVRAAAARFVFYDTFNLEDQEKKSEGDHEEDLKELIAMFNDNFKQLAGEAGYAADLSRNQAIDVMVDGMIEYLPVLSKWDLMLSALLSSAARKAGKASSTKASASLWDDAQLTTLSRVFFAAALRATEGDSDEAEGARKAFTKSLVPQLGLLLTTYQDDSKKVLNLVQLPRCLNLGVFTPKRERKNFKAVLKALKSVYLKQVDPNVLGAVASAFKKLDSAPGLEGDAARFASKMITETATTMRAFDLTEDLEERSEEEVGDIKVGFSRLQGLVARFDHSYELDFKGLFENLVASGENEDLTLDMLKLGYARFMWLRVSAGDAKAASAAGVALLDDLEGVLASRGASTAFKTKACGMAAAVMLAVADAGVVGGALKGLFADHLVETLDRLVASTENDNAEIAADDFNLVGRTATLAAYKFAEFPGLSDIIFSYYLQCGKEADAVMKLRMNTIRKDSGSQRLLSVQFGALKRAFETGEDTAEEKTKDLAARFCLLHGFHADRRSFARFMCDGVDYAFLNGASFLEAAILPYMKRSSLRDLRELWAFFQSREADAQLGQDDAKLVEKFSKLIKTWIARKMGNEQSGMMAPPAARQSRGDEKVSTVLDMDEGDDENEAAAPDDDETQDVDMLEQDNLEDEMSSTSKKRSPKRKSPSSSGSSRSGRRRKRRRS